MTTLETSILIHAARNHVWAILTDLDGYARWNPYLVKIDGSATAGTTITVHSVSASGADPVAAPVEVVAVGPFSMRWEGGLPDRDQFKGDHWFVLESEGETTRLNHFEHFTGTRATAILEAHGDVIRANFILFNKALKAFAESNV